VADDESRGQKADGGARPRQETPHGGRREPVGGKDGQRSKASDEQARRANAGKPKMEAQKSR